MKLYQYWNNSVSLRYRMLWSVLLTMLILLLINIVLASRFGYESATRRHDYFLLNAGNALMHQLSEKQGMVQFTADSRALIALKEDKQDQVFFSLTGMHQVYHFGAADIPLPSDELSEIPNFYFANYAGQPVRLMAVILTDADVPDGRVLVIVGKTLNLHHERSQEWISIVLPAHLFLMCLSCALIWWGVGQGLRPLLALRDEVTSRTSMDLHPLPEQKIISEIRPLIHSFNGLMARLDLSLTSQRRFITNAAHQLRTPLSGFRTQTELIMRMDNVVKIHHALKQLHIAADQAGHMINQLLVLASSEPDAQTSDSFTTLDLAGLARNVTESWVQTALNKKIDLGFEAVAGDFLITGNSLLLGEMLSNLIDNALRYTDAEGLVTVRIARDDGRIRLEIEDNGSGIPETEREKVFERFYRVPGTLQKGCGLGLAIVKEIAHRHQAEIFVLSGTDGYGTLVRIVFAGGK